MRAALISLTLAVAANLGVSGLAAAQDAVNQEPWYQAITVNGFLEASYSHNFDRPESEINTLRVFDYDNGEVKLDVAELVVQKPASRPGELGFRFDATAGQSVPAVAAAAGLFRDSDTGEAHDYDLQQVFVSWIAPVGEGLRIDAGKFVTPFGMEVIEGYDGYNDNQTRSLLFGYAIPFTHTGLRVSYPFTGKLTVSAMVVQGWDNWQDNNGAKSLVVQLALAPSPRWALYLNAMGGPEQRDDTRDRRNLYNVVATFKPDGRLAFGLDGVIGDEGGLLASGARARWSAVAGYARWALGGDFALALRAEMFDDPDGVRTGTAQTLHEVTLTPEWKLGEHFVLRGDLRRDHSDADVFQDHATPASS
ncbi:MAG: porin, partial [Thermoanaerobaculia bacterium]|nr:porin [Thermoanaerobaculia bacterium]